MTLKFITNKLKKIDCVFRATYFYVGRKQLFLRRITYIVLLFFSIFSSYSQVGNTNLGVGSLKSISSGSFNVAIGDSTLTSLSSGRYSVALGFGAGRNFTGSDGFFIGFKSGFNSTNANDNTFIGYLSGYYSTRSDNTFLGNLSGFHNTEGDDNTFLGEGTGFRNTTGSDNTFVGHKAGASLAVTTVSINNSNGSVTTGTTSNPATGSNNTALGSNALLNLTTGFRNTAIGTNAGRDINSSFGTAPADINPSNYGSYNTFVGDSTGIDVGRGAYNTFVGQAAGATTENGSRNTFVGYQAGYQNNLSSDSNGNLNTYMGHRTGYTNRKGNYNVLIGARSDFSSSASSSNRNNYNVILGYNSKIGTSTSSSGGKDNTIIVGSNSVVDANYTMAFGHNISATVDSTMVLGGETHRVSVGIGTNTPSTKASLELADTDKGFLINRLTTAQRTAMAMNLTTADAGMMIYDNDEKILYTWKGNGWSMSSADSLEQRVKKLENATSAVGITDKVPQKFNYQTSLVNNNGTPVQNQNVTFRISILQTSSTGDAVFEETHSVTTSSNGLTSFQIGGGTTVSGTFETITWHADEYYLKVEVDINGGTAYQDFGTTQLLSVPYALHARTADRLTGSITGGSSSNSIASAGTVENQKIATLQETNEIAFLKDEIDALKKLVISLQKQLESKK